MAFAVRKWPVQPDPRGVDFSIDGWAYGAIAPWTWILKTTNATGLFAVFNGGVTCKATSITPSDTIWSNVDVLPNNVSCTIRILGHQIPVGGPPGQSIQIFVTIRQFAVDAASGFKAYLFPYAIQVLSPITVIVLTGFDGTIPDPFSMTPAIWNL